MTERPRVRIVDADRATFELLEEWLAADGIRAIDGHGDGARCELAVVDLPFPREQAAASLQQIADENPGTPILVLSSGFFANVDCAGPCARELGVSGVLPKPVAREVLLAAVHRLLPR